MPRPPVTRRVFLQSTASATSLAVAGRLLPEAAHAEEESSGVIDAHSHIWTPDESRFPLRAGVTPADLSPPSFTDEELLALARPVGVEKVVLIAHTQYYGFDNRYLIDAAKRAPQTFRVVGMVDDRLPDPDDRMRQLKTQFVTGFRITPSIRGDALWLDNPGMRAMWRCAAETRQAMCCLIDPRHLPQVRQMCAAFPDTPVVVDHFARVGVDGTIREQDLRNLCSLAANQNTHVKISAFYALGRKSPPYEDLLPMIRRVYEAFGPERLMWASDAPYQVVGEHSYAASLRLVRERLDFVPGSDLEKLLRTTAKKVYFELT